MNKIMAAVMTFGALLPVSGAAQSASSILPVRIGAYAPAAGGCEAAAAAFIYIEDKGIGANKTAGKVLSVKQDGNFYVLDVLWVEAGSNEAEGDRGKVQIEVKDEHSFFFSNTTSNKILMRWCS